MNRHTGKDVKMFRVGIRSVVVQALEAPRSRKPQTRTVYHIMARTRH